MWRRLLPAIVLMLGMLAPCGVAASDPPPTTVRYQSMAPDLAVTGPFDEVQRVVDFAPGAVNALHSHGGTGLVTVLAGAITVRAAGVEQTYQTGESWVEAPGWVHDAINPGTMPATIVVTFILPKGATLTTPVPPTGNQPPPPAPTLRHESKAPDLTVAGSFDEVQRVVDFAPGAVNPLHSHGGTGLVTVLAGAITVRAAGVERTYQVGESWVEAPDWVHDAVNPGATMAAIVVTFVLPKGATLTTPVTPALPSAGGGATARRAIPPWLIALIGGSLLLSGWRVVATPRPWRQRR